MNLQTTIAKAIAIAAHKGQMYGTSEAVPYVRHITGVAASVWATTQGEDEVVAAAWLHDVLEDTDLTRTDLRAAGVSERVINIVEALTRREGEIYSDYILRVAKNRSAIKIKIADLKFNLAHSPRESLKQRYESALQTLEFALV